VTRIGWPITTGALLAESTDFVDDIKYQRLLPSQMESHFSERLQQNREMLLEDVLAHGPAIPQPTPHWTNTVDPQAVAYAVRIQWGYEVRGQLGDTWASARGDDAYKTDYYRLFQERNAKRRSQPMVWSLSESRWKRISSSSERRLKRLFRARMRWVAGSFMNQV